MARAAHSDASARPSIAADVLLLSAGHLLAFVDRAKVAGALPAIRAQIAMSDQQAAWVIGTAFAAGYGLTLIVLAMAPSGGPGASARRMAAGILIWATASAATGLAHSFPALLAVRSVMGVGQALFIPAALSRIVAHSAAPGGPARGLSIFTAASSFGRSAGLLAFGLTLAIIQLAGTGQATAWRWTFLLTALPNLILAVWVLVRVGPPIRERGSASTSAGRSRRAEAAYLLLAVPPIILIQATQGWLPSLFVDSYRLSPSQAATWLGAVFLIGGPGSQLIGGWLMQRIPRWHATVPIVVAVAMVAAIPAYAMLAFAPHVVLALVGAMLANLTVGIAAFVALFGWQGLIAPERRVAGNSVFLTMITVIGIGLGPLFTGFATDQGVALRWALSALAAACALFVVVMAAVVQPLYQRFRFA